MPWTGIRSNGLAIVKALPALWVCALALAADPAQPDPPPPAPSATNTPAPTDSADVGPGAKQVSEGGDDLPDIRARNYAVRVVRRSNSNRTYLFDDTTDAKPTVGRILLLKREGDNIMAFRILKNYTDVKRFAAKRVRRYGQHRILDSGESFLGIEKLSDLAPPPNTAQDNADLKELEGAGGAGGSGGGSGPPPPSGGEGGGPLPDTSSYDPELDAGSSPPPSGAVDSDDSKDSPDDDEDASSIQVEEVMPMDLHTHWLTGEFGFFRNSTPTGGIFYPAGGGFRYGLTLGRMIFLRKAHVQDSVTVEGGIFFYKVLNYATTSDAYSVMPLVGTGRYNILLSENFSVFIYAGLLQNRVISAVGDDSGTGRAALASTLLAGGGGAILRVGPSWEARVDLGIDMIGGGLMLRF